MASRGFPFQVNTGRCSSQESITLPGFLASISLLLSTIYIFFLF